MADPGWQDERRPPAAWDDGPSGPITGDCRSDRDPVAELRQLAPWTPNGRGEHPLLIAIGEVKPEQKDDLDRLLALYERADPNARRTAWAYAQARGIPANAACLAGVCAPYQTEPTKRSWWIFTEAMPGAREMVEILRGIVVLRRRSKEELAAEASQAATGALDYQRIVAADRNTPDERKHPIAEAFSKLSEQEQAALMVQLRDLLGKAVDGAASSTAG